jgi:hypothetical protein
VAEVAAAALQQVALFDQLRQAVALQPAAGRARPAVAEEGLAVLGLQRASTMRLLQAQQVVANGLGGTCSWGSVLDGAVADVAAVLGAVEVDAAHAFVGALLRQLAPNRPAR